MPTANNPNPTSTDLISTVSGQTWQLGDTGFSLRAELNNPKISSIFFSTYYVANGSNNQTTTGLILIVREYDDSEERIPLVFGQSVQVEKMNGCYDLKLQKADGSLFNSGDAFNFSYVALTSNKKITLRSIENINNSVYVLNPRSIDITIATANTLTALVTQNVYCSKVLVFNPSSTDTIQIYVNSSTEYIDLLPETYWMFDFETNTLFNLKNIAVEVPTANDVIQILYFA